LPDAVRRYVVELVAGTLGHLNAESLPAPLRQVARFTPSKRGRLGQLAVIAGLEHDEDFRAAVAEALSDRLPDVSGAAPSALHRAEDVAAAAYLLRPEGWQELLADAAAEVEARAAQTRTVELDVVHRLQEQLAASRAERRADAERWRREVAAAQAEAADLRRRLGDARERARRAEADAAAARAAAEEAANTATARVGAAEAEARRLRSRVDEAEAAVTAARRAGRAERAAADLRLRLLLESIESAARALREQLHLPMTRATDRPIDALPGAQASETGWVDVTDPAVLEALLRLPRAHLVIDGYNVTKTGFGSLPLEDQRTRLVAALAPLAARTGAEVTVVFDGSEVSGVRVSEPRGVRVRFSAPGETADDYIGELVDREAAPRVVVVTSDREVAEGVRRAGARPVPSVTLLRLLDRG
jgi:predicted RNA-binding protein with PIN domain